MSNVSWVQGGGPLAPFADGYAAELAQLGFTRNSVVTHVVLMGQLSRWMTEVGLEVGGMAEERVEGFFDARRALGQRRVPTGRTLVPMFNYLRAQRAVPAAAASVLTPIEDLLACYRRHLIEDRDLAPSTVVSYEAQARLFLAELKGDGREEARVEALSGADVNGFLLSECTRVSVGSAKNRVNALRSLLRFLHIEGRIRANLAAAVPPVAGWRDTALPSTLTVSQVSELVSSCDRSEPVGLRDFAILMLLARLGLRCCEVVGLALDDIHWRVGELTVRGKGSGGERLPLLADVGEALAAYLGAGRGEANTRRVFLTSLAPRRALQPVSIGHVVHRACERTGLAPVGPPIAPCTGH